MEIQEDGSARLHVRRSKTDPEAEGAVLYIGIDAATALVAVMPEGFAVVDLSTLVFGLSASQIGRTVQAAAKAAGLAEGFTGHSGRVGLAQDQGGHRRGDVHPDGYRPVEELAYAGALHPGSGGAVVPEPSTTGRAGD